MISDFSLSIYKGEVRRYKAAKSSVRSVATAPPCLQRQHKAKGGCSLTQRLRHLPHWQLLPFCPQHSRGYQQEQPENQRISGVTDPAP